MSFNKFTKCAGYAHEVRNEIDFGQALMVNDPRCEPFWPTNRCSRIAGRFISGWMKSLMTGMASSVR
jgi:hypothetical protein